MYKLKYRSRFILCRRLLFQLLHPWSKARKKESSMLRLAKWSYQGLSLKCASPKKKNACFTYCCFACGFKRFFICMKLSVTDIAASSSIANAWMLWSCSKQSTTQRDSVSDWLLIARENSKSCHSQSESSAAKLRHEPVYIGTTWSLKTSDRILKFNFQFLFSKWVITVEIS